MLSNEYLMLNALLVMCGEDHVRILDDADILPQFPTLTPGECEELISALKTAGYINLKYSGEGEYCLSVNAKGSAALSAEKERLRLEEERRQAEEARRQEEERARAAELQRIEEERQRQEAERKKAEELARLEQERRDKERLEQERRIAAERERREKELAELRAIAQKVGIRPENGTAVFSAPTKPQEPVAAVSVAQPEVKTTAVAEKTEPTAVESLSSVPCAPEEPNVSAPIAVAPVETADEYGALTSAVAGKLKQELEVKAAQNSDIVIREEVITSKMLRIVVRAAFCSGLFGSLIGGIVVGVILHFIA